MTCPFLACRVGSGFLLLLTGCASHPAATPDAFNPRLHLALETKPAPATSLDPTAFTVHVTDAAGQPVSGAKTTVRLTMPSMAMGDNPVTMSEQAAGTYAGTGRFTMGGAWRATVDRIQRRGQRCASVSAASAMTLNPAYLLALGMGLASGFSHCIGMCGIFVVSYAGMPDKGETRRFLRPTRHLLFHGGRLAALALLGLAGGVIGALGHRWAVAQGVVSLLVGVAMLGLALGLAGAFPRFRLPEPDVLAASGGVLRRVYGRVLRSRHALKPLAVGVFVGFLPCGLTYNALLATFTLRPLSGALLMLCFGLGTIPGLLALALFGQTLFSGLLMRLPFRLAMTRVSALFMAALGFAFLWRGWTSAF